MGASNWIDASLEKGLEQSASGDTVDLGDFTQYAEDEIEGE